MDDDDGHLRGVDDTLLYEQWEAIRKEEAVLEEEEQRRWSLDVVTQAQALQQQRVGGEAEGCLTWEEATRRAQRYRE